MSITYRGYSDTPINDFTVFVEASDKNEATLKIYGFLKKTFNLSEDNIDLYNVYFESYMQNKGAIDEKTRLLESAWSCHEGKKKILSLVSNPLFIHDNPSLLNLWSSLKDDIDSIPLRYAD